MNSRDANHLPPDEPARWDRRVDEGTESYDEAEAHSKGVTLRPGRLAYIAMRRTLALRRAEAMPEGNEKDQLMAEINQRFPQ